MSRVEHSWSGDGLLEGTVVSGSGVPGEPARPESEPEPQPKKPGAIRLMWRLHGPFIRPFLWLIAIWVDAAAAHHAVPAASVLLTAGPVMVVYFRLRRRGDDEVALRRGMGTDSWDRNSRSPLSFAQRPAPAETA